MEILTNLTPLRWTRRKDGRCTPKYNTGTYNLKVCKQESRDITHLQEYCERYKQTKKIQHD